MPEPHPSKRRALVVVACGLAVLLGVIGVALATSSGEPWRRTAPPIRISGWAPYWQTIEAYDSLDRNADVFGDVSLFAYSAVGPDRIEPNPGLAADAIPRFAERARQAGVPFLATVVDDGEAGVMAATLADPTTRATHVRTIVELITTGGFDGVDLDYETFAFDDPRETWAGTRPNWVQFLRELDAALGDRMLVVSVPAVYDGGRTDASGYWVYDHAAIGTIVDRMKIMAYDYSTSTPGPIAPIDWVRGVAGSIADLVPPEKVDLGIPAYGRDWPSSVAGSCPADQVPGTESVTVLTAPEVAAANGVEPEWDEETAEMHFDYTETLTGPGTDGVETMCTVVRTVRYLDHRALQARAWVAHRHDLHGVAVWALGNEDPATWRALRSARAGVDAAAPEPARGSGGDEGATG